MSNRDWIFAFVRHDGEPAVAISEANEYDEVGSLDIGEELIEELEELLPPGMEAVADWVYSYEASRSACRKALIALGFTEDERLAEEFEAA